MLLDWEYLLLIIGIKQRTTTDTFDFPFSCMDIVSRACFFISSCTCTGACPNNPLTPMPALSGRDEPWPFFHFWRHHFWPKLASSILSFCRRKQSLQRCPDLSDPSNALVNCNPTPKPPRIVGILRGNSGGNTKILYWFLAPAPGGIPEIYGLYFSRGGGEGGVFCFYFIEYRWNTVILPVPAKRIWCDGDDCSPGGVLPIMAYTGGLRPKGVPFSGFRYIKG